MFAFHIYVLESGYLRRHPRQPCRSHTPACRTPRFLLKETDQTVDIGSSLIQLS